MRNQWIKTLILVLILAMLIGGLMYYKHKYSTYADEEDYDPMEQFIYDDDDYVYDESEDDDESEELDDSEEYDDEVEEDSEQESN